jgi:hypothetical protein
VDIKVPAWSCVLLACRSAASPPVFFGPQMTAAMHVTTHHMTTEAVWQFLRIQDSDSVAVGLSISTRGFSSKLPAALFDKLFLGPRSQSPRGDSPLLGGGWWGKCSNARRTDTRITHHTSAAVIQGGPPGCFSMFLQPRPSSPP